LRHFGITFTDYIEEVKKAVEKEKDAPGYFPGYHALHKKIREVLNLHVPRNMVYEVMADVNPQGLEDRGGVGQPKRARRIGTFIY